MASTHGLNNGFILCSAYAPFFHVISKDFYLSYLLEQSDDLLREREPICFVVVRSSGKFIFSMFS